MTRAPSTRRASVKKAAPAAKRVKAASKTVVRPKAPAHKKSAPSRRTPKPPEVAPSPPKTPPPPRATLGAAFLAAWGVELAKLEARPLALVGAVHVSVATPRLARPVWLLVTTGLWEHGVELSLRAARGKDDLAPPPWALALLSMLVEDTLAGQVPGPHQSLALDRPLEGAADITGCVFTPEGLLAPVETRWLKVTPLLTIGVTADEERLVREWNPASLVEVLTRMDPALTTDPDRASMLLSPRARQQIEQRVEREGSSLQVMRATTSRVEGSTWTLSADAVPTFIGLLKGRLAHLRPFSVIGAATVHVVPADFAAFSVEGEPTLRLSQTGARQLRSQLRARPGRYALDALPGFTLEVV
jgi:hypothetical protein